ncbi:hypothetical protein DMN77_08020 [Paenibacillus sp. 79R4]|uniref:DUF6711 family protein n=1 Tax=Paenibacillus sp. 79R4 TaxID=2212847 RepID=UPI0015BEE279|nr:DUF6711 family protein [Paenibacillus sp. 79R4]NWL87549.1 hypothetical protein [Paenibacillus sp. 79R4]
MEIKINGAEIAAYPAPDGFTVTTLDLDDGEASGRTTDGTMTRSRIAVKRQIQMSFSALPWKTTSALLQQVKDEYVNVTYPDPMTGKYETKSFYVGDRPALVALEDFDGTLWWSGVQFTLTEQ